MATKFCIVLGTYERLLYGVDVDVGTLNDGLFVIIMKNGFIIPAHTGCITAVACGGRYMASGGSDDTIKLFDMKKRKELGTLALQEKTVTSLSFFKGSHLFATGEDGNVSIYMSKVWELLKTLKATKNSRLNDFAIHPSGKMGMSISKNKTLILWDLTEGKKILKSKTRSEPFRIKYSQLGTKYAILHTDAGIDVFDINSSSKIAVVNISVKTNSIVFYQESYLIYGGEDKIIYILNLNTKETLQFPSGHKYRIRELDVHQLPSSTHGGQTLLISGSSDGCIKIWKIHNPIEDTQQKINLEFLQAHSIDARITCMSISSE